MGMGGILDMNCIDGEVESKRVNLGDNLDKSSCYPELLNNYLRCLTGPTFIVSIPNKGGLCFSLSKTIPSFRVQKYY